MLSTAAAVLGAIALGASVIFTFYAFPIVMLAQRPDAPVSHALSWGRDTFGLFGAHLIFGIPYLAAIYAFTRKITGLLPAGPEMKK